MGRTSIDPQSAAAEAEADDELNVTGALHDVSNALTVLLGWLAEARAEGAPPETVAYALDVIDRRARMARDLARRAIGAAPPDAAEAELETVIADVLSSLRVEAERRGITLARRRIAPTVRGRGPSDMSHVLTNLLLNAIAHAPTKSTIWVDAVANDATLSVDVVDEGPGVPASRAAAIFHGDSTRAGGAGVGLRHARAVARGVGGELELVVAVPLAEGAVAPETRAGARFRLRWPRSDTRVPPPPPSVTRVRPLEGKRVLVVEDDSDVLDLLETALTARGAIVTLARTADELSRVLSGSGEAPHDAALLDLSPIVDDVTGALAALATHSPRATIVVITGSVGGVLEGVPQDSIRWVRKPFEVGEVVAALVDPSSRDDDA